MNKLFSYSLKRSKISSLIRKINSNKDFCTKLEEIEEPVLYTQHNSYAYEIMLNQPKKLNALDYKMVKSMLKRVQEWIPDNIDSSSSDEEGAKSIKEENYPKMVIMSGKGKAFCAGGDISSIYKQRTLKDGLKLNKNFFRYEYLLDYSITRMKPVQVAFWQGAVMGGGCGISVNAPIRIATDNTVFAMPETAIGLFPDVGATWFLPRIFNNNTAMGLYVGLSGDRIKGKDLAKCGYATHYVNLENLEKLKAELITKANGSTTLESITNICNSFSDFTYTPKEYSYSKSEMINKIFKLDSLIENVERLKALEKNGLEAEKLWATTTLTNFAKFSPTSMHVTFEQIKRGASIKSIEEAFNVEAQLISVFLENNDFFEGVRALLIDKDNSPKWEFKSIEDVKVEEIIAKYFNRKVDEAGDVSEED
jgi:3-hydroxyisobutyryl-CoA hydrolase